MNSSLYSNSLVDLFSDNLEKHDHNIKKNTETLIAYLISKKPKTVYEDISSESLLGTLLQYEFVGHIFTLRIEQQTQKNIEKLEINLNLSKGCVEESKIGLIIKTRTEFLLLK